MQIKDIKWDFDAWEEYLYWQAETRKNVKRINQRRTILIQLISASNKFYQQIIRY